MDYLIDKIPLFLLISCLGISLVALYQTNFLLHYREVLDVKLFYCVKQPLFFRGIHKDTYLFQILFNIFFSLQKLAVKVLISGNEIFFFKPPL